MIKIGNSNIVGVSKGNTQFSKIYKGVDLYWSKTPSLIQVNIEFNEGVESITVNGTVYNEPTTIYFEYRSTLEWSATLSNGYEYAITSGTVVLNEKKIYTIKVGNPNNEIWYRTSDNQPMKFSAYGDNRLQFMFGENRKNLYIVSNLYDESSGYCKLTVDDNIVNISNFSATDTLLSINYIPETTEEITAELISRNSTYSIFFGNLPLVKSISRCYLNSLTTNYATSESKISNIQIGNMNLLENISQSFISVQASSNYTKNTVTIDIIKLGNTPSLKEIGDEFICVKTGSGNSPQATLNIGVLEFGDMLELETIGNYFLSGVDTGGKGTPKITINSLTLPNAPKLKNLGTGCFTNLSVNTVYVPSESYDIWSSLIPSLKSKFVKI